MGFTKSNSDHTLFIKNKNESYMSILVYVNDIMIANSDDAAVDVFKAELHSHFKFRDIGPLKYFFGLEVARSAKGISLCQRKYTLKLLDEVGFLGRKPSSIPLDPYIKLSKDVGVLLENPKTYGKLVRKLQYLAITRPDIAYALTTLGQFSAAPRDTHLKVVHKVLRYLKGTVGQGLFYAASSNFALRGFADSDWGACIDTRKSIFGYAMFVGDSLVSWI